MGPKVLTLLLLLTIFGVITVDQAFYGFIVYAVIDVVRHMVIGAWKMN